MDMLVNREAIGSSSSYYVPGKSCLCLAIHSPRKGIVEDIHLTDFREGGVFKEGMNYTSIET
ncbi:hypothetical protein QUC31_002245 [Theobroma cacao]